MSDERIVRDEALGAALAGVSGRAPEGEVDWEALRARIAHGTAATQPRGRAWRWWAGGLAGTAAAASLAALLTTAGPEVGPQGGADPVVAQGLPTVEEILGADVTEEELRALLSGASEVEALLLLAASDGEGEL